METFLRHLTFIICLPLFFLVFAPFLYLVAFILLLIKKILTILKKILRLDYGDFLTGMDGLFGSDSPYKKPKMACVFTYLLNGPVTVEELKAKLALAVEKQCQDGYPQMKQQLTTWMGFAIWKPVTDYRIDDYIFSLTTEKIQALIGEPAITDENRSQFSHNIGKLPFQKGRAPWDIYVCPTTSKYAPEGNASVLFYRCHHTLGDAALLEKFLSKLFNTEEHLHHVTNLVDQGTVMKGEPLIDLNGTLLSIYHLVRALVYRSDFNDLHNLWTRPRSQYSYQSIVVPLEKIKRIRKSLNVSFSAVVWTVQTLALRQCFIHLKASIPAAVHSVVSVPVDFCTSDALNRISSLLIQFPTVEQDGRKICQIIEKDFREQKNTKFSKIIYQLASFVSLMPQQTKFLYPGWLFSTVGGTNFSAGKRLKTFGPHSVVHYSAMAHMPSNFAMWFFSMGYGDNLYLTIGISEDIMPDRSSLQPFMRMIEEELDNLAA